MDVKKNEENIYLLKGIRSCNIYFLDFEKKAVIDTGFPSEIEVNMEAFAESGIDLKKIDYILNTHSHGDHIGGNAYLKKIYPEAQIAASEKSLIYQERRTKRNLLEGAEDHFPEYKIDLFLKDGDTLDLGGMVLNVIETPGHTIDSISFFDNERKIVFSGDVVYKEVVSQVDYYQDLMLSLEELKRSYEKLSSLDAKIFYPGHSVAIENPKENINVCLRKVARFERQPELIIINNFVPSAEYYIHKNPGCTQQVLKDFFIENMLKFRDQPFLIKITEERFGEMIDKMISLMRVMNMIKEESGALFLVNKINQNLNKQ